MPVFDESLAHENAPVSTPADTMFGYLNRANRVEAARIRALIEEWVGRYPASHRDKLIKGLRERPPLELRC